MADDFDINLDELQALMECRGSLAVEKVAIFVKL
jgi:hypothetical protein